MAASWNTRRRETENQVKQDQKGFVLPETKNVVIAGKAGPKRSLQYDPEEGVITGTSGMSNFWNEFAVVAKRAGLAIEDMEVAIRQFVLLHLDGIVADVWEKIWGKKPSQAFLEKTPLIKQFSDIEGQNELTPELLDALFSNVALWPYKVSPTTDSVSFQNPEDPRGERPIHRFDMPLFVEFYRTLTQGEFKIEPKNVFWLYFLMFFVGKTGIALKDILESEPFQRRLKLKNVDNLLDYFNGFVAVIDLSPEAVIKSGIAQEHREQLIFDWTIFGSRLYLHNSQPRCIIIVPALEQPTEEVEPEPEPVKPSGSSFGVSSNRINNTRNELFSHRPKPIQTNAFESTNHMRVHTAKYLGIGSDIAKHFITDRSMLQELDSSMKSRGFVSKKIASDIFQQWEGSHTVCAPLGDQIVDLVSRVNATLDDDKKLITTSDKMVALVAAHLGTTWPIAWEARFGAPSPATYKAIEDHRQVYPSGLTTDSQTRALAISADIAKNR